MDFAGASELKVVSGFVFFNLRGIPIPRRGFGVPLFFRRISVKISKEQKEGLARFVDTLAVSAIIGAVVGATGHSPLTAIEVIGLVVASPILLGFGFLLRRP